MQYSDAQTDTETNSQANSQSDACKLSLTIKLTIAMIGVFAFLQVYAIQAILPVLVAELSISEVTAGMFVGATVFGIAIMSPITGMISERYGRKSIIVGSMLLLAVPTCLLGMVHSAALISVLRFLQGLSIPGMTVVTLAYISEEYQQQQLAELSTFFVSGTVLGGFLGRFLLGHLEELIGWRMAIIVMGVITFLGALFIGKTLPKSRNFVVSDAKNQTAKDFVLHFKNKQLVASCLLGFCILFSLIGCFTFINLHLAASPYFVSSAGLANIFAIYLLGVVITPLTVRLINAVGATNTILIALALSMSGLLTSLLAPISIIIVGLAMASTGIFIAQSATVNYIICNVTQGRSLATGLYYMTYYTGGGIGAWLCGLAYSAYQWQAVIAVLVVIQLLGMLIAFGLMKSR